MTNRNEPTSFTRGALGQIVLFTVSGVLAFGVDILLLYAIMSQGIPFYIGRALSFIGAASFTWWFNRRYTFSATRPKPASWNEWLRFLIAMAIGGLVNYFVSIWSFQTLVTARDHPVLALGLGAIAGMAINFFSARVVIYKSLTRIR